MPPSTKAFSQACENNKHFILDHIEHEFVTGNTVLEIGSRTAQHVIFFAQRMPLVRWIPSDIPENMATLIDGLEGHQLDNIAPPVALDVTQEPWPVSVANASYRTACVDGVFTANTLHIMPQHAVECFFNGVGRVLRPGGKLCVYGPFKYGGEFTTPSNAQFDASLKSQYPGSGLRDFEVVAELAKAQDMRLIADHAMPANNQLLVWQMGA
jgi:SAM-dependent methyltransferase